MVKAQGGVGVVWGVYVCVGRPWRRPGCRPRRSSGPQSRQRRGQRPPALHPSVHGPTGLKQRLTWLVWWMDGPYSAAEAARASLLSNAEADKTQALAALRQELAARITTAEQVHTYYTPTTCMPACIASTGVAPRLI